MRQKMKNMFEKLEIQKIREKAVDNFINSSTKQEITLAPSAYIRKKFHAVPQSIRGLIAQNVLQHGSMTWEEATRAYSVSRYTVYRMITEEGKRNDVDDEHKNKTQPICSKKR